jgi:hypothetical protein
VRLSPALEFVGRVSKSRFLHQLCHRVFCDPLGEHMMILLTVYVSAEIDLG